MTFKSHAIHRMLSLCPVLIDGLATGTNSGWLAPVLKNSENSTYEITLSSEERSWVASLHLLFTVCGSILCFLSIDKLGRKKILFCCSLCYLLEWVIIRFTKSVYMIYLSRIIFGIQVGMAFPTVIVLVGENSSPKQRGIFVSLNQMLYFGGMITQYVVGTYCSYYTVATINLAVGFLYFASVFMMKETVQFLILKGRYEEAERNHRWLFSEDTNEFEKLKLDIEKSATSSLSLAEFFHTPVFYKSVALAMCTTVLITSTGYYTLGTYSSIAFSSSRTLSPNEFTICFGLIQFASSLGSSLFIHHLNRRTLLLSALAAAALTNLTTAVLYYTQANVTAMPSFPWLIFTTISLFSAIAFMGLQPVSMVLRSELFPQKVKSLGVVLTNIGSFMTTFLSTFMFLKIYETFGMFSNFLFFSGMCCVAFVFAYVFVPETRGKSLLEIQQMLETSNSKM